MRLGIVTATTNLDRSRDCRLSWTRLAASTEIPVFTVVNGWEGGGPQGWHHSYVMADRWYCHTPEILGTVPAYALGVQKALEEGCEIIACLHDDVLVEDGRGWDRQVVRAFEGNPRLGLCGFGGATGLGHHDIYKLPYDPMQLARLDFVSNMRDAEAHGRRGTRVEPVVCLDGFSQIGRREFWEGWSTPGTLGPGTTTAHPMLVSERAPGGNLFQRMEALGVIHHFYDGMLGCFARRLGWDVAMIPVACHHFGGQTAVGDPKYAVWANDKTSGRGDAGFWQQAHRIGYDNFKDVLPLRLKESSHGETQEQHRPT